MDLQSPKQTKNKIRPRQLATKEEKIKIMYAIKERKEPTSTSISVNDKGEKREKKKRSSKKKVEEQKD